MFSNFLKVASTDYTICSILKLDLQNGEQEMAINDH